LNKQFVAPLIKKSKKNGPESQKEPPNGFIRLFRGAFFSLKQEKSLWNEENIRQDERDKQDLCIDRNIIT